MNNTVLDRWRRLLPDGAAGAALAAVLALLALGCSSSERPSRYAGRPLTNRDIRPPAFLAGPAGIFLTNESSFNARVSLQTPDPLNKAQPITGRLLGKGNRLVFVPVNSDISFIWDVQANSGFVSDGPLQGYAPFSATIRVTNIIEKASNTGQALEEVNGQPCSRTEETLALSDGSTANLTVWRSAKPKAFPMRIKCVDPGSQFTLDIIDVQMEPMEDDVFVPQEGFSKFTSVETLMDEVMLRRSPGHKGLPSEPERVAPPITPGERPRVGY